MPQSSGQQCPFAGFNYQLMRNFLFAAAFAESFQRNYFAVLTIAPKAFANKLISQVHAFRENVLKEGYRERLVFVTYEDYCKSIDKYTGMGAGGLSEFLREAIRRQVLCD